MRLDGELKKWSNTISSDRETLKLNFNVDPASNPDIPQEMQTLEFLNYLAYNTLRIWIWNADGLIPLGSVKLHLRELLRGGAPGIRVKQEVEILSEYNNVLGKLAIHMENIGRRLGESKMRLNEEAFAKSMLSFRKTSQIYNQALTLRRTTKFMESPIKENEERKTGMPRDYALHMSASASKRGISYWGEKGSKTAVEKYCSLNSSIDINRVLYKMSRDNADYPAIYYSLGQTTVFPFLFYNNTESDSIFRLSLNDPTGMVTVVTDPDEWKFFCIEERYEPPSDFNALYDTEAIRIKKDDHLIIVLKARVENIPKSREQTIKVMIKDSSTLVIAEEKEFRLRYKDTYYDSYYIMNVPEDKTIAISLNADLPKEFYESIKAVRATGPSKFDWRLTEKKLLANYKAPAAPTTKQVLFYLYGDDNCYRLLSIICVDIRAYKFTDFEGIVAKEINTDINITKETLRPQIELKTSNKKELMIGSKYSGIIEKSKDLTIPVSIRSFTIGKQQLLLHCLGSTYHDYRL